MVILSAIGLALVGAMTMPLVFIVLPWSRRRAKVRWAHIWRVCAYSLAIPVAVLLVCAVLFHVEAWIGSPTYRHSETAFQIAVAGPWLGLLVWWAVAIKRYLRMPHSLAIAFFLALIAFLLMPAGIVVVASLAEGG